MGKTPRLQGPDSGKAARHASREIVQGPGLGRGSRVRMQKKRLPATPTATTCTTTRARHEDSVSGLLTRLAPTARTVNPAGAHSGDGLRWQWERPGYSGDDDGGGKAGGHGGGWW